MLTSVEEAQDSIVLVCQRLVESLRVELRYDLLLCILVDSLAVAGHAIGAAGRSRGWCLHDGMCVFNFPVALEELACHSEIGRLAYSEELAQN